MHVLLFLSTRIESGLQGSITYSIWTLKSSKTLCLPGFDNWHTSRTYICLLLLLYTWFWKFIRWNAYSFFPYDFSGSYNFTLFRNLMLYIGPLTFLLVLGRDRFFTVYICFKETFFQFFIRVSVKKISYSSICMHVVFIILLLNYEKTVHVHNYRFFWNGPCFNYPISTLWL